MQYHTKCELEIIYQSYSILNINRDLLV